MDIGAYFVPGIIAGIFIYGIYKKVDVLSAFTEGAKENLMTAFELLPTLTLLMLGVGMFRASGALEALVKLSEPVTEKLGFPSDCLPLVLLRPISGSGALSVLEGILKEKGPDSFSGRVASVLMGSTETTFYTIAVYFGAAKVRKTRHALPSALVGDFTAFLLSALVVRMILG